MTWWLFVSVITDWLSENKVVVLVMLLKSWGINECSQSPYNTISQPIKREYSLATLPEYKVAEAELLKIMKPEYLWHFEVSDSFHRLFG